MHVRALAASLAGGLAIVSGWGHLSAGSWQQTVRAVVIEDLRIGAGGASAHRFGRVLGVGSLEDGGIAVLCLVSAGAELRVFSASGAHRWTRTFGPSGLPVQMAIAGDTIAVQLGVSGVVRILQLRIGVDAPFREDTLTTPRGTTALLLPSPSGPRLVHSVVLAEPEGRFATPRLHPRHVIHVLGASRTGDGPVLSWVDSSPRLVYRTGSVAGPPLNVIQPPWGPTPSFAASNGTLYHARGLDHTIETITVASGNTGRVEIAFSRQPLTSESRLAWLTAWKILPAASLYPDSP
jgi:hypothetical protein